MSNIFRVYQNPRGRYVLMGIEKKLIDSLNSNLHLSQDEIEVVAFGYRLFVYSILGYLAIAILACLLGTLKVTLTAAITASIFRIFSGGAHASTQKRCTIIGAVVFNILGIIADTLHIYLTLDMLNWILWVVSSISLVCFVLYAPADTPGKPITSKVTRSKLKIISIALLVVWFMLFNLIVKGEINIYRQYLLATSLGLAWQSVSLLPSTYKWIVFK